MKTTGGRDATVYRVLEPIPSIGAEPGDYLVFDPTHPMLPFVLQRNLPMSQVGYLSEPGVVELVLDHQPAHEPVSADASLQLVE